MKLPEKLKLWEVLKNEWFLWKEKITLEWSSANDIIRTVNQLIDYLTPEATTDTEEKGDWISKAYYNFNNSCGNKWESDFREAVEKFMPKPVEQTIVSNIRKMYKKGGDVEYWVYWDWYDDAINACIDVILTYTKPVEQELVPLDVEKIINNIYGDFNREHIFLTEKAYNIMEDILSKYWVPKQEEKTREKCSYCWEKHNPIEHVQVSWKIPTPTPQATSVIDVDGIVDEICRFSYLSKKTIKYLWYDWSNPSWYYVEHNKEWIKSILSSLPIQKKRTREEIKSLYPHYERSKIDWALYFAKHIWLLKD